MTTDDVLASLGLQTRRNMTDFLMPALGVFGAGIMVGAGVALMLAPKSGAEFRGAIGSTARRLGRKVVPGKPRILAGIDSMTRDELYEQAQELEIDGRSEMTKSELLDAIRSA